MKLAKLHLGGLLRFEILSKFSRKLLINNDDSMIDA